MSTSRIGKAVNVASPSPLVREPLSHARRAAQIGTRAHGTRQHRDDDALRASESARESKRGRPPGPARAGQEDIRRTWNLEKEKAHSFFRLKRAGKGI